MNALIYHFANFMASATTGIDTGKSLNWNEFYTYMTAYNHYYRLAPSVFIACGIVVAVAVVAAIVIAIDHKKVNA